jgi:Na+/H+-dicarboxylate symporter
MGDGRGRGRRYSGSDGIVTPIRLPVWWTFAALVAGLLVGWLLAGTRAEGPALAIAGPVGTLWLRALQMTIVPLVAALLVGGVAQMVASARAGRIAAWTLGLFYAVLATGTALAAVGMPALLEAFPMPASAVSAGVAEGGTAQAVPGIGDFVASLVAPNVIAAAAETAMLPLVIFFAALAVAITRLAEPQRELMLRLFEALGNAMLTIIGWVLWLAPVGVFALAVGVAVQSGGAVFATLGHYIALVSSFGVAVLLAAYGVAFLGARLGPARFARAVLPAQAVAISTQSSLASLPAMLGACRTLGVREATADFVLPLAVTIFRATSPAMNLAAAIYAAHLAGVELSAGAILAGALVAVITTAGSVSLPGTISYIASVGPIAVAMGVPVEALALLVAVEMVPDIFRTLGNVTMDVAVTATVDRHTDSSA